jgi:hypothetical protein
LDKDNFWGGMSAREVMMPMPTEEILSGNDSLNDIFKRKGNFSSLYYVVDMGGGSFNVLDLNKISKILNNT